MSDCIDCNDCIEVQPILTCTTDITVCDDLGLTTAYQNTFVYIQDVATERVNKFTGTIIGGKVVISPEIVFHPEVRYKIWVNADDDNPFTQELFLIDNYECYCVEFDVFRFFDDTTTSITQFETTLKIKQRI